MIGNFPAVLKEFRPVISQTQPVHLEPTAGSPRSLARAEPSYLTCWSHFIECERDSTH